MPSPDTTGRGAGASPSTVGALFFAAAARHSSVRAVDDRHRKPAVALTYGELAGQVRAFGAGLLAHGVGRGDRVAHFADNRPRWLVTDLAVLAIGAVEVPRGSDTSTPEFEFILGHSGATAAVVQDARLYARLAPSAALKALRLVVLMDDSAADAPTALGGPRIVGFLDGAGRGR